MPPTDADYDVVLAVKITVDDYYLRRSFLDAQWVETDTRQRLRREIERKLPDGYTIDDFEGEYRTYRDERHMRQTIYELRVYL